MRDKETRLEVEEEGKWRSEEWVDDDILKEKKNQENKASSDTMIEVVTQIRKYKVRRRRIVLLS